MKLALFAPGSNIPALTGVRAVAAGMVLLMHLDSQFGRHIEHWLPPIEQGYLGVDIFFILSGFIISHVYGHTNATSSVRGFCRYMWFRFARIYPVHVLTILALVTMVSARGLLDTNVWHINALPYQFLLLNAWVPELSWNIPAWSISAEWAAYICFPFIALLILQKLPILFASILLVAAFALFQVVVVENTGVGRSFLGYPAAVRIAVEFSYGVLIYRLVQLAKPCWHFDWIAALAFFVGLLVPSVPLLQIFLFGVMIAAISLSHGWLSTALSTKTFVLLGNASYAVYMVHFPIIKLIQNINALIGLERPEPLTAHTMVVFWAAVITGCGAVTYLLYERPIQRRMRRMWSN